MPFTPVTPAVTPSPCHRQHLFGQSDADLKQKTWPKRHKQLAKAPKQYEDAFQTPGKSPATDFRQQSHQKELENILKKIIHRKD